MGKNGYVLYAIIIALTSYNVKRFLLLLSRNVSFPQFPFLSSEHSKIYISFLISMFNIINKNTDEILLNKSIDLRELFSYTLLG